MEGRGAGAALVRLLLVLTEVPALAFGPLDFHAVASLGERHVREVSDPRLNRTVDTAEGVRSFDREDQGVLRETYGIVTVVRDLPVVRVSALQACLLKRENIALRDMRNCATQSYDTLGASRVIVLEELREGEHEDSPQRARQNPDRCPEDTPAFPNVHTSPVQSSGIGATKDLWRHKQLETEKYKVQLSITTKLLCYIT